MPSPSVRRPALPAALLVLACLLSILLGAGRADAAVRTLKPVKASGGHVTFRIDVAPSAIRRAHLAAGGRRHRLSTTRLRAAVTKGKLVRQRVPRTLVRTMRATSRRAASVRLVLDVARASRAGAPGTAKQGAPAPASAPAPAAGGCSRDLSTFGAGNWPGACWRPYADSSPWNQRLAPDAKVDPRSSTFVNTLTSWGPGPSDLEAGTADTDSDWQHPTYYAKPSDPTFKIHCVGEYGVDCEIEGMEVKIPDAARQAGSYKRGWGGDGHMTVVETHTGWEYDFWNVRNKPRGGGQIDVGWGGRTRIDGDGLGSNATAAWYGTLAGIIRAQEMQAGRIDHALFMVIKCSGKTPVYPAKEHGSLCPDQNGAIPFGTRFQLDMSPAQIAALDVPAWKRTILTAMAEYGMYVGDTGGSPWDLQFESGSTYTSFGREDEMVKFARSEGLEPYKGVTYFDLKSGVDWKRHLRVIAPCEAERTC